MPARQGIIQTVLGNGEESWDGDGGPALEAACQLPYACEFDAQGNMVACVGRQHRIRQMDARTGIITRVCGTGEAGYAGDGGPALAATWGAPKAMRCDLQDKIIVVDTENFAVRRIDSRTGIVSTIAGGREGGDGDAGPAVDAGLSRAHGCGVGAYGNLYIADTHINRVRVVGL